VSSIEEVRFVKPGTSEHELTWTFFSNYAHVLVCLAENSSARLRDIAGDVGITERATQRIVAHLEEAGVLTKQRRGRRNHYSIDQRQPLPHPLESHRTIGDMLSMILD
jgi:DNA-binding transcriptional regulator PaaX